MRMWPLSFIPHLPCMRTTGYKKFNQLMGLHREMCAARGGGWGRSHPLMGHVWKYPPSKLFAYHKEVMEELKRRSFDLSPIWEDPLYRGYKNKPWSEEEFGNDFKPFPEIDTPEYILACKIDLLSKGIDITKPPGDGQIIWQYASI